MAALVPSTGQCRRSQLLHPEAHLGRDRHRHGAARSSLSLTGSHRGMREIFTLSRTGEGWTLLVVTESLSFCPDGRSTLNGSRNRMRSYIFFPMRYSTASHYFNRLVSD